MAHSDSFRFKTAITAMYILSDRTLDVVNSFQNANVLIHERLYVRPPPYYMDWLEKFYPSITINQDCGPFCIKYINGIQCIKPIGKQFNELLY